MSAAPNLVEIARQCGVHPSTVSRALSASPKGVSADTTRRIRGVAASMGYRPNAAATALKTGRTDIIGVIVPKLTDFVLARIYEGCAEAAQAHDCITIVMSSDDDPEKRLLSVSEFAGRMVTGMVVCDARAHDDSAISLLREKNIPHVLANRRSGDSPSVTLDERLGAGLVAQHLLERGHTRVGVLGGWDYASTCIDRVGGFVTAYAAAGIEVPKSAVAWGPPDAESGFAQASRLLSESPDLSAIFAVNDFAAIGAMGAARAAGRRLGKDFAVVGYNDIPLSSVLPLPLSSVRSDMHAMGRQAVERLLDLRDGKPVEPTLLTPELVVRDSSSTRVSR